MCLLTNWSYSQLLVLRILPHLGSSLLSTMAMTIDCLRYSSTILKTIGSSAKSVSNYNSFHIDASIRAWIIALGIRARSTRFRRNRAGNNLHYHIASLILRQHYGIIHRRAATLVQPVNWNNLLPIKTRHSLQPTLAYLVDLHSVLINCRSVVNKTQEIQLELVNNNLDLCILTETWIKECDTITPTRLCLNGYKSLSIFRQDRVGGGIAIVYKSELNISIASRQPFKTMELLCFSISTGNRLINLITIYRPPDSNVLEFCNELAKLLETNNNLSREIIWLEDFNIAVNKPLVAVPASFLDVLHSFNLINRVDKSTQSFQYSKLNHSWC